MQFPASLYIGRKFCHLTCLIILPKILYQRTNCHSPITRFYPSIGLRLCQLTAQRLPRLGFLVSLGGHSNVLAEPVKPNPVRTAVQCAFYRATPPVNFAFGIAHDVVSHVQNKSDAVGTE